MITTRDEECWQVAVEAPLFNTLTYSNRDLKILSGTPVEVLLGARKVKGIVLGKSNKKNIKLKQIESVRDGLPKIPKPYLDRIKWLSSYYVYPIGQVFKNTYPPLKKKDNSPLPTERELKKHALNSEQRKVLDAIDLHSGFKTHLIHGITGSGKTEIYLKLIEKIEHQALVLVPEISLTPQLVSRFIENFGQNISVIHSQLTNREKTNHWWNIIDQKTKILIGARSSIFCPIKKISLIVVDEEHDSSFKQNDGLRYNAKNAAIMLAKLHNCPIILGSATPSIETWYNAKKKYKLHKLVNRYKNAKLPSVMLEDMTNKTDSSLPPWLSKTLYEKIHSHLKLNRQVALFLNRRGQSYFVCCTSCGEGVKCPNCSVSLILHGNKHLVCHYCNYHKNYSDACDICKSGSVTAIGIGTEGIEQDLEKLFPKNKIIRADRDVINTREDLHEFIKNVEKRKADILVGTQMISKGLNFPNLTLVGVVSLDMSMNIPDFRAEEKTFQLLLQVSGRAGRSDMQSEVVIQTLKPNDEILKMATEYEYDKFFERELRIRRTLQFPPYGRLAMIRASSINQQHAKASLNQIVSLAKNLRSEGKWFDILGPAPSPISKIRGKYRFQTLLKGSREIKMYKICAKLNKISKKQRGVKLSFDIDPLHTL